MCFVWILWEELKIFIQLCSLLPQWRLLRSGSHSLLLVSGDVTRCWICWGARSEDWGKPEKINRELWISDFISVVQSCKKKEISLPEIYNQLLQRAMLYSEVLMMSFFFFLSFLKKTIIVLTGALRMFLWVYVWFSYLWTDRDHLTVGTCLCFFIMLKSFHHLLYTGF